MSCFAGEAVAEIIRRRVREEVHVTCSCGIGPNRLLAKVASDMRKPDGQYSIPSDTTAITRFIDVLPIRKVPGIGKASPGFQSLTSAHIVWDGQPMLSSREPACAQHWPQGVGWTHPNG